MKALLTGLILMLLAVPVRAGETRLSSDDDTLNFDLPFEQAINKQVLRSLLNQAIDAVEDHLELNGKLRNGDQAGDREGRFELRLYPRGKSRSDEHVGAEGSFRFSPEAGNHELSLRFKSSKPSSRAPDPADFL
ncbi:MAG TPA: hypothetical protein VJ805_04750 [Nitrospiraceae bacterium]|nr:hypothetical protein [Nitrospiraceae bacterium]